MDIGEYYSKSFDGFKKNPKLAIPTLVGYILLYVVISLLGVIAILTLMGPGFMSSGHFNPSSINFANIGLVFGIYLVIIVLALIISSYMSAATIGMSKSIINGETPELGVALKNGNKYFLKIIAVSIIIGLLLIIFMLPAVFGIIIGRAYGLGLVLAIIGVIVSLILCLVTPTVFIFANQSIVVCGKSVFGSLKDSVRLLRNNIGDVIVVLIINLVALICVVIFIMFVNIFLNIIPIVGAIIGLILNVIIYAIVNPYLTLVLTYLYVDKKGVLHPEIIAPPESEDVQSEDVD